MRKINRKYYFSVEGECEKWYLLWLQNIINSTEEASCTVTLDCLVEKNPIKRVKKMTIVDDTEITHVFDYESNDEFHVTQFKNTLTNMKETHKMGKRVKYKLGYSNFSFELWIILHKMDCNRSINNRHQYLDLINRAYDTSFVGMNQYKTEANFKKLLNELTLNDVRKAISRSKKIMQHNAEVGYVEQVHKGYKYFKENPSLSIWEVIENILKDCDLFE